MEIWKPVEEFPGYQVSDLGRVRNIGTGRVLKPRPSGNGYLSLCLGGRNYRSIHRLVAKAFLPNQDGLPQVNHVDCDKRNNAASNLEWASSNSNMKHAFDHGLLANLACCKPRSGADHKRSTAVTMVEDGGSLLIHFESIRQAAKLTGIDFSTIYGVITGKFSAAGGRQWRKTKEA